MFTQPPQVALNIPRPHVRSRESESFSHGQSISPRIARARCRGKTLFGMHPRAACGFPCVNPCNALYHYRQLTADDRIPPRVCVLMNQIDSASGWMSLAAVRSKNLV